MIIEKNRVVSIDYTLTDDKNNVLDSTSGQEPLDYLHGFGNIIPGLENALEGKSQGEHFTVHIPAADAYGERNDQMIAEISIENFKGVDEVKPGMQFHTQGPEGIRLITVTSVEGDMVTIDGNHPLAGVNLNFDGAITAIREASEEELLHGHVHGDDHGDHCGCGDACGCEGEGCDDEGCGCGDACGEGCSH
ncbi:peptidyl-prolyl cis-trans isomerase [Spirochaetia bacterium]|nr:peptidyl-prolyl cis-trans isomerase [Spirochaetia bacterium]